MTAPHLPVIIAISRLLPAVVVGSLTGELGLSRGWRGGTGEREDDISLGTSLTRARCEGLDMLLGIPVVGECRLYGMVGCGQVYDQSSN